MSAMMKVAHSDAARDESGSSRNRYSRLRRLGALCCSVDACSPALRALDCDEMSKIRRCEPSCSFRLAAVGEMRLLLTQPQSHTHIGSKHMVMNRSQRNFGHALGVAAVEPEPLHPVFPRQVLGLVVVVGCGKHAQRVPAYSQKVWRQHSPQQAHGHRTERT